MAVNASCAKCDTPLENGSITTDDGAEVQVSQCPSCEGMIKSPLCCGEDMSCTI
jgi:NAD-dependent SIR2 family protein deacetylase